MDRSIGRLARGAINFAAFCIFIVGAIFTVDQMFLMALALALLPAAAWIVGRAYSGGVACTRLVPAMCGVGEIVSVTLTVTNTARLSRPALRLSDVLPRGLTAVGQPSGLVLDLRPGESRPVTYELEAARRGRYRLPLARLDSTDPMGFYLFSRHCSVASEIDVYPKLLPLRRVFWEDVVVMGEQSQETAQRRGVGLEFHGVREYQPGDELRHVHWRTTARTGALAVTEYAQGASLETIVALDLSRAAYARFGKDRDEALDCAVTLAASVCAYLIRRGGTVRLLTAADVDDAAPPAGGNAALVDMLETLVGATADSELSLIEALRRAPVLNDPARTLLCITPADGHETAAGFAAGQTTTGGPMFGLQIGTPQHPSPPLWSAQWRAVAPGDGLIKVLEGS